MDEPLYIEIEVEYYEHADFRTSKTLDFLERSLDEWTLDMLE